MDHVKRILAIETSGRLGSVAALLDTTQGVELLSEVSLTGTQRTAQALAPTLQKMLEKVGWLPASIGLLAVAIGPGSFTGLRIGVTTAKTLAYSLSTEIIGVNTLEALAAQAPPSGAPLWTILDAQRQELFAARFVSVDDGSMTAVRDTAIVSQEHWLTELQPGDRVIGPALSRLAARLPPGVESLAEDSWQPMASSVGKIAWREYQSGRRDDLWQLSPNYYRASAAEEKLHP
jgi:tRNA threonylcarbamoyladenosine biosynthesis protein TsaB